MKIIFSRKGFDSAFGGGPSPILNGKMLSLPIPEDKKFTIRYSDVQSGWALSNVGLIVEQLLPQKAKANGYVHLDPDLRREALQTRHPDWRPLFGQVDQAQSHLANEGVGVGDLFLFYGLYRGHLRSGTLALRMERSDTSEAAPNATSFGGGWLWRRFCEYVLLLTGPPGRTTILTLLISVVPTILSTLRRRRHLTECRERECSSATTMDFA